MIFGFQMDPHLQSIKVIPKFLLKSPCAASLSSKTSGYSFLRDKIDYPEFQDNQSFSLIRGFMVCHCPIFKTFMDRRAGFKITLYD